MFNIVDQLAGGDVLKWDAVLQIDCATALIKLKMEQEKTAFQKRLSKVYEDKRKRK